jgi:hypothetical protein
MVSWEKIGKFPGSTVNRTEERVIVSDYDIPDRIQSDAPNFSRHIPILKFTLSPTKQSPKNFPIVTHSTKKGGAEILKGILAGDEKASARRSPFARAANRNRPELKIG